MPNWKDCDILSAQHLQTINETIQDLASRPFIVHKYDYGVQECILDASRLQDNIILLRKITGIFPDGVCVDQECNIEVDVPRERELFVYVAIIGRDGNPADRYLRYTAPIKDYYTTDMSYVQCIRHKLYVFVRSCPPNGYVVCLLHA